MTIQIFDCEQGSPAWYEARRGIPTASRFHTVLAKGEGKTRKAYMLELAGEVVTGELAESYSNAHMERGKAMEEEARNYYEFVRDAQVQKVGFVRNGNAGCSPDGLIGDKGVKEIKTKLPHILIELILKDQFPPEHVAQCQGALWVTERDWVDLTCYWPKVPALIKRANRDETYIKNLASEVGRFNDELAEVVAKVRRYGLAEAA